MADYDNTFAKRGRDYKYATETYPTALFNEFKTAASIICSTHPTTVLNIPAACVPLDLYLPSTIKYTCFESNKDFAALSNIPYASLFEIPVPNNSIDAIICLASLHHATHAERQIFYKECMRILTPGGALIIGDVLQDSPQDRWLNIFVNKYNPSGHNGLFWNAADIEYLKSVGFSVDFSTYTYTWDFESHADIIDFSRHLFGLEKISDDVLDDGLREFLHVQKDDIHIDWQLGYFIATKSPEST